MFDMTNKDKIWEKDLKVGERVVIKGGGVGRIAHTKEKGWHININPDGVFKPKFYNSFEELQKDVLSKIR